MVSALFFKVKWTSDACTYVCCPNIVYRSRTGGGAPNTIGNTEARRIGATDFLVAVKDAVGVHGYLTLVTHLKSLHARVITIPECREAFKLGLKDHVELMQRFDDYMPKRFGGSS